jgi:hypothetical protein
MSTLSWQNRLYAQLLRDAQRGAISRHCAYLAAGWLSFFMSRPDLGKRKSASLGAVAGGGVILVLLLLLAGPILNTLQPVLRAAGTLPGVTWVVVAIVAVLAWRYLVGRKVLHAFAAATSGL